MFEDAFYFEVVHAKIETLSYIIINITYISMTYKSIFEALEEHKFVLTQTGTSATDTLYEKCVKVKTAATLSDNNMIILQASIKPSVRNCCSISIKQPAGAVKKKCHLKLLAEDSQALNKTIDIVVAKNWHITDFEIVECKAS